MRKAMMSKKLEELYARYNRRECVHPDPLEFVYAYARPEDREVAGVIASSLAYGRVAQILVSVGRVLELLGPSPAEFIDDASQRDLAEALKDFRHRFTSGEEVAALLAGIARARGRHGSLRDCFTAGLNSPDDLAGGLAAFVTELGAAAGGRLPHLLPSPADGSACKRLNLFLRWMVRSDNVDPGGWSGVRASMLVVPLDTHMHRIARGLRFTQRNDTSWRTAAEITTAFRRLAPADPVRYDFALTRLGIRRDARLDELLEDAEPRRVAAHA
jgi:uncharacterized protein (TIGR02757 family)